jgi:type IV pilus assembly protein PilW
MRLQRGFTLVEVAIAALLMLLAVASALSLVARGRGAHRSAEVRVRLEETARAALDVLAYEVRLAGYLGPLTPGSPVAGAVRVGDPAPAELAVGGSCVEALALDLAAPLAGADSAYAAMPGMPLGCRPSPQGRAMPDTDTLVIRRASVEPAGLDPGRLQLEVTRRAGRLLSNGQPALGQRAEVHDLDVSAFYVSADSTGAPGHPSLRRKRLVGGAAPAFQDEELVAGVEDLQVEIGVDESGDGNDAADRYWPLHDVPVEARMRSVRIWVVVRSDLGEPLTTELAPLSYANRVLAGGRSRHARLLASRSVEMRNAAVLP